MEHVLNSFAGTLQKQGPQLQLSHMAASATHIRAPAETTVPGGFLYLSLVITVYIKSVLSDVCTATPNSFAYCVNGVSYSIPCVSECQVGLS